MAAKKKAAAKKSTAKTAMGTKRPNPEPEVIEVDVEAEREKALGKTAEQKEYVAYHKGDFQKTDPVTGEPRNLQK